MSSPHVVSIPPRLQRLLAPQPRFTWARETDTNRAPLEAYISNRFLKTYGAQLYTYLPWFLEMACCDSTSAVVGVKLANDGPLFIENYLDTPIQQRLADITGKEYQRDQIVEIGNLVASHRGASQLLFLILAETLLRAGQEWMVFTATQQVSQLINKLHCQWLDLGLADPVRLGSKQQYWGNYYDSAPRVCAIHLPSALAGARNNITQSIILHLFRNQTELLAQDFAGVDNQNLNAAQGLQAC